VRVLHVIPAVAPRYGGPSTAVVAICRALSAAGIEPLVATTDADGGGRLAVPLGETTTWKGTQAIFFRKTFSESYKYSRAFAAWIDSHVRPFDVVHIHAVLSHLCLAAAAACRRHGVPYVIRPLGTLAPWSLGQKSFRKRLLLRFGGINALRSAAVVQYTSVEEMAGVESVFDVSPGVVVPLGVDSELLASSVPSSVERGRNPYVLALSRIHPKKNIEALIKGFVLATAGRERWSLVVAGTGEPEYIESLRRLAERLSVENRVRFVGWIDGDRKRELMRNASLFALCSKHENFGVAVLEALAAGVPAVITRQVDLASAVEQTRAGWVIDDVDESLRLALTHAIENPVERDARGRAAREHACQFAWPAVAAQLIRVYESVQQKPVVPQSVPLMVPNP